MKSPDQHLSWGKFFVIIHPMLVLKKKSTQLTKAPSKIPLLHEHPDLMTDQLWFAQILPPTELEVWHTRFQYYSLHLKLKEVRVS